MTKKSTKHQPVTLPVSNVNPGLSFVPDGKYVKLTYDPDLTPTLAYRFCLLMNPSQAQLSQFFNVSSCTLESWIYSYPDFAEAIHRGKMIADIEVAHALHSRAVGYAYTEVHTEEGLTNDGQSYTKTKVLEKHMPADVGAAKLWLTARQKAVWAHDNRSNERPDSAYLGKVTKQLKERMGAPKAEK